ncbi:MAG: alpha/beta fold hydrolase [Blautia sp.]|nr:alpha/beta fold hydrolase [Blautia sp.]
MKRIMEEHYAEEMKNVVLWYLVERKETAIYEVEEGEPLYYAHYIADDPKASIVMLHGFSETIDKFNEMVFYFLQEGFHVWQLEMREHGRSTRSTEDQALVHITDYNRLLLDFHGFVNEIVKKAPETEGKPLYLYGHSMGGGVSACYLERYPGDFSRAVLSSPMLELNSGGKPVWAAALAAKACILLGGGAKYMPGSVPFSGKPDFENSCAASSERYTYWLEQQKNNPLFQMCITSFSTAYSFLKLTKEALKPENCRRIKAKVLLFQAGMDNMVMPGGQERFIRQIGERGRLIMMENVKHEIYMSKDQELDFYLKMIFRFFKENQ